MQDLPVFEAVAEVIQQISLSVLSNVSATTLGVDIKAKKKLLHDNESDCQVFYIRVSSSQELDLEQCFKDGVFRRLSEVLLYMQNGEDEGHLSVQRSSLPDTPGSVKDVFWLDQRDQGGVILKCRHSTHVPCIDSSEISPFVIHFRVVQRECHIISAGRQIYTFLHKMKLLNKKVEAAFSMKVCGAVCQTDFSVKKYLSVKDVSLVEDIKYFFGKGCLKSMWCGTVKAFSGRTVSVTATDQIYQLSVSTITCLYPLTERFPQAQDLPGITGNIVINLYGPELTPLLISSEHRQELDIRSLLEWGEFSLCLKDTSLVTHCDVTVAATLTNQLYLPPWASGCTSFLLCLAVFIIDNQAEQDSARHFEIIKVLQDDPKSLKRLCCPVGESLYSSLKRIFVYRETEHARLYRKTYVQCIEMITSSMSDIFNHSTDMDFRNSMVALLQAENKEDMNQKLKTHLFQIAKVPDAINKETDSDDGDHEIDEWEDRISIWHRNEDPKHQQDTQESQRSFSDSTSQDFPETSQQMNNDGAELNTSDPEQEIIMDIQEGLFDFRNSENSSIQNWHLGPNDEQEQARYQDFTDLTVQHLPFDVLTEQELDFFPDGLRNEHTLAADGQLMENSGAADHEELATIEVSSENVNSGIPSHHTETGDEWLNDVMLDVADWI